MSEAVRTITASRFRARDWEPFGWVPLPDTDPADGDHGLTFEWGDPHVNIISHAPEEVTRSASGILCTRMYRHDTHTQTLLALDGPSVLAVAPADVQFTVPGDLESDIATVRAFLLHPLDALVLHQGTWHWGPFPLGDEPVHLFNVQGLGYADDNASVDLAALGLDLEVRVAA